jgi:hypothetical protein
LLNKKFWNYHNTFQQWLPSKGFYIAQQDLDTTNNIIIHPQNANYPINSKTQVIGLAHFEKYLVEVRSA